MKFFVGFILTICAMTAHAGMYAEVNGFFSTDTFVTGTNAAYSKTYYALDIHSNLEAKARFYAGFHVDQIATSEEFSAGSVATLTSLNMGPMAMWIMDHRKTFSVSAGYNVIANGVYTPAGGSATTLTGSGLWGTFGVTPEVAENVYVGVRLNYYSLTYIKATTGSSASDVSYSRAMIFPTFSFAWRY